MRKVDLSTLNLVQELELRTIVKSEGLKVAKMLINSGLQLIQTGANVVVRNFDNDLIAGSPFSKHHKCSFTSLALTFD